MLKNALIITFITSLPLIATAEMKGMTDENMSDISGQGGVYLTGEFSINKDGGPLWSDTNNDGIQDRAGVNCGDEVGDVCGLRLAVKLNQNSEGWYVIDDLSGSFSFEGLTLRTETLTTVPDYNNVTLVNGEPVAAEVTLPNGGDEVLQLGLPGTVSFKEFKFKYAVANNGEFGVTNPNGDAFQQTDIFGVQIDGDLTLQGNLLLFPVD